MSTLHLIVTTPNGHGVMSRSVYESLPRPVKATVEILAVSPTHAKARWIYQHLPQDWSDVALTWRPDDDRAETVAGVLHAVS
jgi:glucose dehydrogenase